VLVDREYFCVEKIAVNGTRKAGSLRGANEQAGLAYLFAAAGSGRIRASSPDGSPGAFEAVDLPSRGMVAVPASAPDWEIEDLGLEAEGQLELIRITPRWPKVAA